MTDKIDNRARHMKAIKEQNRGRIIAHYRDNPTTTQDGCAKALGICTYTVRKHLKAIKASSC